MSENNEPKSVSRELMFSSIVSEAAGYYKIITVTASSFLGGSMIFLEKIARNPICFSVWILAFGWIMLIASIGLVGWVRSGNLKSGWQALEGKFSEAKIIDEQTRWGSEAALICLVLGMLALAFFGFVNL